jgi:hypothetical protein
VTLDKGKPVKPTLKTIEVNLVGVLYSTSRLLYIHSIYAIPSLALGSALFNSQPD